MNWILGEGLMVEAKPSLAERMQVDTSLQLTFAEERDRKGGIMQPSSVLAAAAFGRRGDAIREALSGSFVNRHKTPSGCGTGTRERA